MGYGGDTTTIMVLNVDFQCCSCYKKVKKILCKFPQIRNQEYDEKNNRVTISVVCCDPEKLRDKLCSKGCGVIKSIEIKPPEPKKTKPQTNAPPPPSEPKKTPEPQPEPVYIMPVCIVPMPMPIQEYPQPPRGYCCGQCYEGHTGGPCYQWYGRPVPPPPCHHYCGCYGPYGCCRGCYVRRC